MEKSNSFLIRSFYQSFYSKNFYREVATLRQGSGVSFLALVSLFQALAFGIFLAVITASFLKVDKEQIFNQIPEVTIKNGQMSINKPSPYYLTSNGKNVAVIDVENNYDNKTIDEILANMNSFKVDYLATKTKIFSKERDKSYKVYNLSDLQQRSIKFDNTDVRKLFGMGVYVLLPLIIIVSFAGLLIYRLIQMLLYSLFAIIINRTPKFDYQTLQRLTAHALWPSILLGIIFHLTGIHGGFPICLAVALIYIYFALKSARTI